MRRSAFVVSAVVACLVLSACQTRVLTFDGSAGGAYQDQVLTADGDDVYSFTGTAGPMEVASLDTNVGANLRTIVWPAHAPADPDAETCATWTDRKGDLAQLGAAFRVRSGRRQKLQAVTVTQNIYFHAYWLFNVHVWDLSTNPPMKQVAQVDLKPYLDTNPAGPLRFCARVLGDTAALKLWSPSTEAEPAWTDAMRARTVKLPTSARGAGTAGWFVGHLAAGDTATLSDLMAWAYRATAASTRSTGPTTGDTGTTLQVEATRNP